MNAKKPDWKNTKKANQAKDDEGMSYDCDSRDGKMRLVWEIL